MTGGANDLHVIMCYKTVGIDCMRKLHNNIQNETRLNNITHFNHTNKLIHSIELFYMMSEQPNPVGFDLFSYVNTFFCSNKFA